MARRIGRVFVLGAFIALAGCNKTAPPIAAADLGTVAEEINAIETRWSRDFGKKTAEEVAAYYAPDAVVMQVGAPPLQGIDEITDATLKIATDPNYNLTFKSQKIDVAASGDIAYARGTYEVRMTDPASQQIGAASGQYLTIYKRQPDRSWKVVEGISS